MEELNQLSPVSSGCLTLTLLLLGAICAFILVGIYMLFIALI